MLTHGELPENLNFSGTCINMKEEQAYHETDINLAVPCQFDQLAYCIYTSGTTGTPKGTLIEHRRVIHLIEGLRNAVYSAYDGVCMWPCSLHIILMLQSSKYMLPCC